ncbi:MAG TPA: hypothetical protein VFP65_19910 [Anaeromyxobacteraceae bacterium]|nr:hypothetical protein [Anaeromyxobacteraceae bacterium]
MSDDLTVPHLETLFRKLPREGNLPELVTQRVRLDTQDGRVFLAFARAGQGSLGFAGWEAVPGMTGEPEVTFYILAAEHPGDPLQIISREGPQGVLAGAVLEDRPPTDVG